MVDMKGSTCKHCSKKYHYCGSCDSDTSCDNGYCSTKCLMESKEFKAAKENAQVFYDSLSDEQRKQFEKFQSDEGSYEDMTLYEEEPAPPPVRIRHEGLFACQRFFNEGEEHSCYLTKIEKFFGVK